MMKRHLLKSRISLLTVTSADAQSEERLVVDRDLLRRVDVWPYEKVEVSNHDNGARLSMPVADGDAASGTVAVFGPAAHLLRPGHKISLCSYAVMGEEEIPQYQRRAITVDAKNRLK